MVDFGRRGNGQQTSRPWQVAWCAACTVEWVGMGHRPNWILLAQILYAEPEQQ
jgi:hypothetical protein